VEDRLFPGWARIVVYANPLTYVVRAYRETLLGNALPSARDLGSTAAFAIVAFVFGGLFFRYMKRGFADVL
jgi:lipopolysaccharide transport system permease protein